MAKILILFSTTDGQTKNICERIKAILTRQSAHIVQISPIDNAASIHLETFDTIVLGASIRYGYHSKKVFSFIKKNQHILEHKDNAFFSVNVVARKANKNQPETNPYMQKFLKKVSWKPKRLAVFAGKIDYPRYHTFDRSLIRFIMLITGGPTDPKGTFEFTDWEQVEAFGEEIARASPAP